MSAIEPELMRQLIKALEDKLRSEPSDNRLWDAETIARYSNRSADYVRKMYIPKPSFPLAIQPDQTSQRLYEPAEVKEWFRNHRERRSV